MNTKRFNMTDYRRNAANRCMQHVMRLLEMTEEEYCWYKYEYGLAYLQRYLQGDAHVIGILERSLIFWNWWKLHWTIREEEYLRGLDKLERLCVDTRYDEYCAMHNPWLLVDELQPNAVVLGESYDNMMQDVIKGKA